MHESQGMPGPLQILFKTILITLKNNEKHRLCQPFSCTNEVRMKYECSFPEELPEELASLSSSASALEAAQEKLLAGRTWAEKEQPLGIASDRGPAGNSPWEWVKTQPYLG